MTKYPMTNDEIPNDETPVGELVEESVPWVDVEGIGRLREDGKAYDLEERTAQFGEMVIDFAKLVPTT